MPDSARVVVSLMNRLLLALCSDERSRLRTDLEPVALVLGDILHESHETVEYVYFPSSSIVSLVYTMANGMTAELGIVGNEGIVGVAQILGGRSMPHRAVVQIAGDAFRIRAVSLRAEFARGGPCQSWLLRYTQALITQMGQTAACNRLHAVEQRLCRWILSCHDRMQGDELQMTQEYIAHMLGGRRQSVTVAAGLLQDAGLIHYSRGHITILDRLGLERTACECYSVVKSEYDRLLLWPTPVAQSPASGRYNL